MCQNAAGAETEPGPAVRRRGPFGATPAGDSSTPRAPGDGRSVSGGAFRYQRQKKKRTTWEAVRSYSIWAKPPVSSFGTRFSELRDAVAASGRPRAYSGPPDPSLGIFRGAGLEPGALPRPSAIRKGPTRRTRPKPGTTPRPRKPPPFEAKGKTWTDANSSSFATFDSASTFPGAGIRVPVKGAAGLTARGARGDRWLARSRGPVGGNRSTYRRNLGAGPDCRHSSSSTVGPRPKDEFRRPAEGPQRPRPKAGFMGASTTPGRAHLTA